MNRDADSAGVIAFPPLLYAVTLVLGVILHFLAPIGRLPALPARLTGVVILAGAILLAKSAQDAMRRAGTNIRPDQPTTAIVTGGPYRFSRNPLYIATTALYTGFALLLPALWPLVLLVPLLIIVQWGVILREERYLEEKFGGTYLSYKARVRRWI